MPNWSTDRLQQLIDDEKMKAMEEFQTSQWQIQAIQPTWSTQTTAPITTTLPEAPAMTPQWTPPTIRQELATPQVVAPTPVTPEVAPVEEPVSLPIWKRALEVFAAPFEWIDNYLIKPTLAIAGTAAGVTPELERLPGEDYFEWKRRSWAEWKAPGIDISIPWSDDPWRLDVKGVLELAPWLLIPGAGQVGGAVGGGLKAARGVAGILGKMGKVGRVVGKAVEYSPWGLVEKTAGAAMKAGLKGVTGVTGKISTAVSERLYGKIKEPELTPAVQELTKFFDEALAVRGKYTKAIPEQLTAKQSARLAVLEKQWQEGKITSLERSERKVLASGGLQKEFTIEPFLAKKYDKAKMNELLDPLYRKVEGGFEKEDVVQAFKELLLKGKPMEPRFYNDIISAYGIKFAKSLKNFSMKPASFRDQILDLLNIPRAVLASGDLSGTFRQGLILSLVYPERVPRAFWRQLKAFASEKLSLDMDDALRNDPFHITATRRMKIEFTTVRQGERSLVGMAAKEEPYASNIARNFPFVRRSERAFTTFLNQMRMGSAKTSYGVMKAHEDSILKALTDRGASANEIAKAQRALDSQMALMGNFINLASGRGVLPANLNKYAPVFNTVLFSARYQLSTLQLPRQIGRMLLSGNPYMRKAAARALITFVGGGSAILGLVNMTGKGKVELDPRSGDFGKLVVGDTRLDIWRGYVQYIRFAAQFMTGERKSAYGNMNKDERFNIAMRFLQSKASPAAGLLADLTKGENYMGEPLFNETTGFIKMARDRLFPLAMQDVMDAMEQNGMNAIWTAAPATLGIGVLTYVNDLVRLKADIARDMGYDSWDNIDPKTQKEIENTNVELQTAYLQFDRQVMGTAWGDWRNAGNSIEDIFRQNVDNATAQYQQSTDPNRGITFRDKVSSAFTERRGGYKAREKELRFEDIVRRINIPKTAEALVELGPEQLAINTYNQALYGDDMYDQFGDYRFDEAEIRKQELKASLEPGMFEYIEEYQGIKYENFPQEFQELIRAKQVMKPYWAIADDVAKMFGKAFANSSRGQSFISKLRKAKRLSNPEMNRYYEMFYAQG